MPRVQEYLPEVEASGPQGALSPNTELLSAEGRGLEQLGSDVGKANDAIYNRVSQAETSDVYESIAYKRAELTQSIQDQTNDGTINTDSIKQQYHDWVDSQSDQYQTDAGKNAFNRQSARLGANMTIMAARGQTAVAGHNAVASFANGMNTDANTLENNPSQFEDTYTSAMENLQQQVDNGLIKATDAPKIQQTIGQKYMESSIRGYAKISPDDAKIFLDDGKADQFLTPDQKKQMYSEVRSYKTASIIDQERSDTMAKKAQAAEAEQWGQANIQKLYSGSLSTKSILSAPMTTEQKEHWMNMQKAQSQMEEKTDPGVYNDVVRRINLPDNDPQKISDPFQSEITAKVGNGISTKDMSGIISYFDKTPQGQILTTQRKQMMDLAKANLTKSNPMLGIQDPDGEYNLMNFTNALQQAEGNLRQQNKPVSDLYDPTSPSFFGNKLSQYQSSPQQIMQKLADKARGTATPNPVKIDTTPGVIPSTNNTGPEGNASSEVERKTSDGKTAVFDSKTKKFLRYK